MIEQLKNMTQENKELLLQDLCSRLPYGVKCQFEDTIEIIKEIWFCEDEGWQVDGEKTSTCIHAVKPYLFPMSSMTEEEKKEYRKVCELDTEILEKHPMDGSPFPAMYNSQDWLNKHHYDYRGLIPMGLANDATGKNIYNN